MNIENSCQSSRHRAYCHILFSRNFMIFFNIHNYICVHLKLLFGYGVSQGSVFICPIWIAMDLLIFIEKIIKTLPTILECQLCPKINGHIYLWTYFGLFISLVYLYIFKLIQYCLNYACLYLKVESFNFILCHICLSYSWPYIFPHKS